MLGMLLILLDQTVGHLMYSIPLPITMYSLPVCAERDVITEVSLYSASRGTDHYVFWVFSEVETPFCTLSTVNFVLNTN